MTPHFNDIYEIPNKVLKVDLFPSFFLCDLLESLDFVELLTGFGFTGDVTVAVALDGVCGFEEGAEPLAGEGDPAGRPAASATGDVIFDALATLTGVDLPEAGPPMPPLPVFFSIPGGDGLVVTRLTAGLDLMAEDFGLDAAAVANA